MNKTTLMFFCYICCIFISCDGYKELEIVNNADYDVTKYSPIMYATRKNPNITPIYPDTTITSASYFGMNVHAKSFYDTYLMTYGAIHKYNDGGRWIIDLLYDNLNTDTISWFFLYTDTIKKYGIEPSLKKNIVAQRYDISRDDMYHIQLRHKLCFPPDSQMSHIKMYPPYGTYDENGPRIKQLNL